MLQMWPILSAHCNLFAGPLVELLYSLRAKLLALCSQASHGPGLCTVPFQGFASPHRLPGVLSVAW